MAGKVAFLLGFALFFFLQSSAAQTVHIVGDSAGWKIPPTGAASYATWAAGKTFKVGDSLVFNFTTNLDDVTRVPKSSYDLCSDENEIGESIEIGPATIVLSSPGEYYFISSENNHCQQGQKFAINVTGAPGAPATPSATVPTSTPGKAPTTHVVGDATGWKIPVGGAAFYVTWATGKNFAIGDSLVFNFTSNMDDVVRVSKKSFDLCSDDAETGEDIDVGPATIVLSTPGEYYFISSEDGHCQQGQKLAINVTGTASGPMTPPSTAGPTPVNHVVGDAVGWTVPQGGAAFYVNWTKDKTFAVGDSLVFNFKPNVHDVEKVPKSSFDVCSDENEIGEAIETSPATILLDSPGEHYYISSENNDCQLGQKLAINVVAAGSNGGSPGSSTSATPSSGASASGPGASNSPGSSANTIVVAMSATLFGLVLNLF